MSDVVVDAALSPEERQDRILALLAERRRLAVADLARCFSTSEDSIRRDLRALAAAGRIRRVHGAVLPAASEPAAFEARGAQQAGAKSRIAAVAAGFVRDGMTVLVDGGTTTLATVRALPADRRCVIVTTSIPVADALADRPSVEVIVIGGSFDRASRTVVGAAAVEAVGAVRADLCLVGLCSLDARAGVTAAGYEEALVKRAMIGAASEVVAVATPDKLGAASRFHVAPASAVGRLVTAAGAAPDAVADLAALGIDIVTA